MPKRTNLDDAKNVEHVDDLGEVVQDKRQEWRATAAKARRRQRRYTKRMTEELARLARDNDFGHDHEL
ncbi:MAG: hypothetical protein MK098_13675 [Marinovum sp.]|nr:hypothetical protein [Marinovum sp.]